MKIPNNIGGQINLNDVEDNFPAIFFSLNINNDFQQSCNFISENCFSPTGFSSEMLINNWQIFLNQISEKDQLLFKEKFFLAKANKSRLEFKFLFGNDNINQHNQSNHHHHHHHRRDNHDV